MSFLSVAIESFEGSSSKEIEYSQFLYLNDEQLAKVMERFSDCKSVTFSESKIKTEYGHTRLRGYTEPSGEVRYELTTKVHTDDSKVKVEDNVDITTNMYKALVTLAHSQVIRMRYYIPITKEGEPVLKADRSPLEWELDIYVIGNLTSETDGVQVSNWVKLELEVDKATLDDVVQYIPFDYEKIILSDTQDAAERAQITHLYDTEYNVLNKTA